jgi:hypothetical protein
MERSTSTGGEVQPTLPPRDMELTSNINIVPPLHSHIQLFYQFGDQMGL